MNEDVAGRRFAGQWMHAHARVLDRNPGQVQVNAQR